MFFFSRNKIYLPRIAYQPFAGHPRHHCMLNKQRPKDRPLSFKQFFLHWFRTLRRLSECQFGTRFVCFTFLNNYQAKSFRSGLNSVVNSNLNHIEHKIKRWSGTTESLLVKDEFEKPNGDFRILQFNQSEVVAGVWIVVVDLDGFASVEPTYLCIVKRVWMKIMWNVKWMNENTNSQITCPIFIWLGRKYLLHILKNIIYQSTQLCRFSCSLQINRLRSIMQLLPYRFSCLSMAEFFICFFCRICAFFPVKIIEYMWHMKHIYADGNFAWAKWITRIFLRQFNHPW